MPYFDPAGRECLYSDAYAGGRLKPGFKHIVGDGEAIHVDIMAMDRAPGRVTLRDSQQSVTDAQDAYSAMVDDLTSAWKRPPGQQPTAEQQALADAGDTPESAYSAMVANMTGAWQR